MPPIYPSTALKNQQREIKAHADEEIVYITENGKGKYIFVSEEVMKHLIQREIENALYEQRMHDALQRSRGDFEQGRSYDSREAMMAAVAEKRVQNAQS